MKHKKLFSYILISSVLIISLMLGQVFATKRSLKVRSIDTMKYSRDLARLKLNDAVFDSVIERQIRLIAETGATHVALGTPYDQEFVPYLSRWVKIARKYHLKVWFRGNLSGWEKWFDYPQITRKAHTLGIEKFILENKQLMMDGDIFTSCPECENGGSEDPRLGDLKSYRLFLVSEYTVVKNAFKKIGKKVTANYYSMNGDVARMVMDKDTTKALDGIITIDHYTKTHEQLIRDIQEYAQTSGGKVVLGEIGVPIPDIHGDLNENEKAEWLAALLAALERMPEVEGINYWVSVGGSTQLWDNQGFGKLSAKVLNRAYRGATVKGRVSLANAKFSEASVMTLGQTYKTDVNGIFTIPYYLDGQELKVKAIGYAKEAKIHLFQNSDGSIKVSYSKVNAGYRYSGFEAIRSLFTGIMNNLGILLTRK